MEPLSGETSVVSPARSTALRGSACLLRARYVTVVFKERRDDTDAHKTWWFAHIDYVAIVTGRLQLTREGYGVAFDGPSRSMIDNAPRVMRAIISPAGMEHLIQTSRSSEPNILWTCRGRVYAHAYPTHEGGHAEV